MREHATVAEDTFDPQHPQKSSQSSISLVQFQDIQYTTDATKNLTYAQSKMNNPIAFKDGRLRRERTVFSNRLASPH